MPLAVDVELGFNRGAKATCHLLHVTFCFAFRLWAQQEVMKHDDNLPSLIAKPPSAWGNCLCPQTQGFPQPPNSDMLPFVQPQCLWKARVWDWG